MAKRAPNSQPTWTDVKQYLLNYDHPGLVALIHDLYAANKDNQAFLHARFGLGKDQLEPYKRTIERWLWPDVFRNQDTSVATAKQAIAAYKKAVGAPEGLVELMVFYCERAAGFCSDIAGDDVAYYDALVRMFEQALKLIGTLPDPQREAFVRRLDVVRNVSHQFGYGVGDDMDHLLANYQ